MSQQESFTLEVGNSHVQGMLTPPTDQEAQRFATVLICRGLHTFDDETAALLNDIAAALHAAGIATVDYEARSAKMILEDFHAYTADDNLLDAITVFGWLQARAEVDSSAVGVLGYDVGGITAACLSGRADHINRLALLAPGGPAKNGHRATPADIPEGYLESIAQMNPLEALLRYDRPTMVMHGAADRDIDPDTSVQYQRALESAGRHVAHLQVALADHTFSWSESRLACVDQLERFFAGMKH
jgi:dienelactone hydrolase